MEKVKICIEKTIEDDKNKISYLQKHGSLKDRALFYKTKLWPVGSTITIGFIEFPKPDIEITNFFKNSLDKNGKPIVFDPLQIYIINSYSSFTYNDIPDMIKKIVIERIQPIVNLELKFIDNPYDANIRITFNSDKGCYSYIGKDCLGIPKNSGTMNFGWFDVGTILHEFGHAIGMVHEHQSPFLNPIKWNKEAMYKWASEQLGWDENEVNEQIINKYDILQLNGTIFDPESIMLYFISNNLTFDDTGTGVNTRLSPYDVVYMNSIYPGSKQTPNEFYLNVYGEYIYSYINSNIINNIKIFILKYKIFIVVGVLVLYTIIANICIKNLK